MPKNLWMVLLALLALTACNADRRPPGTTDTGAPGGAPGVGAGEYWSTPDNGHSPLQMTPINLAQTVRVGQDVTLAVEPSGGQGTYQLIWTQTSGPDVTLDNRTAINPTFIAPFVAQTTDLTFEVSLTDATGANVKLVFTVTVFVPGLTANAGQDFSVREDHKAALHGFASGGAATASLTWKQTNGPAVKLAGILSPNPSFKVPGGLPDGTKLVFELTVTDGDKTVKDSVEVTLEAQPLLVDAGPDQNVAENNSATLHGTASGGSALQMAWTQKLGPAVSLLNGDTANPSFTAPIVSAPTQLTFELEVSEGGASKTDSVTLTVMPNLPVVNAGSDGQSPEGPGPIMQLSGDVRGGFPPYDFQWTKSAGIDVGALSNADQLSASFSPPDVSGTEVVTFQLQVTDSVGHVVTDTVNVSIFDSPAGVLSAEAGSDVRVQEGSRITINGVGQGGVPPYNYSWSQTTGMTTLALSSPPQQDQTLIVEAPAVTGGNQLTTLELTVTDSASNSATDTVICTVVDVPFAVDAGTDVTVQLGQQAALHAQVSHALGTVRYTWTKTSGPAATLSMATTGNPTLVASAAGTFVFEVTAQDSINSATDTVTVEVQAPALSADAGSDVQVGANHTVHLHAAAIGGAAPYTYSWMQRSGDNVSLAGANTANPSFTSPSVIGTNALEFEVTIHDAAGQVATDRVSVQQVGVPLVLSAFPFLKGAAGSSAHPNGTIISGTPPYHVVATQRSGPTPTSMRVRLRPPDGVEVLFTSGLAGTYVIDVTLTDASGQSVVQTLTVGAAAIGTATEGTHAVTCGDIDKQIPCTDLEMVIADTAKCPDARPYAMNDIFKVNGMVSEFRRCVDGATCYHLYWEGTAQNAACRPFDPAGATGDLACHLCCYGDGCNAQSNPPENTLYTEHNTGP